MKAYALIAAFLCITAMAAESTIQLPKPQIPGKSNLQELLQNRQSTRVFDDEPLSEQQLANLLWSAYGVNRDDGKLTVPAALNRHAFTLYLLTAQGVMQYDNKNGTLTEVLDKDIRAMAEGRKTLGPEMAPASTPSMKSPFPGMSLKMVVSATRRTVAPAAGPRVLRPSAIARMSVR